MNAEAKAMRRERIQIVLIALLAGTIAIAFNMAALALADLVPLATAHGGLLRLLIMLTGNVVSVPPGSTVQAAFHFGMGLAMALFYAFALESALPGPAWCKGLVYAILVWVANAAIVLPLTGEGFAGHRNLSWAGMIWFAAAHVLFFVLLAILYQQFRRWMDSSQRIHRAIGG